VTVLNVLLCNIYQFSYNSDFHKIKLNSVINISNKKKENRDGFEHRDSNLFMFYVIATCMADNYQMDRMLFNLCSLLCEAELPSC